MIRCLATGHDVIARLMNDASISPPDAQQMEWLQFLGFAPPASPEKTAHATKPGKGPRRNDKTH